MPHRRRARVPWGCSMQFYRCLAFPDYVSILDSCCVYTTTRNLALGDGVRMALGAHIARLGRFRANRGHLYGQKFAWLKRTLTASWSYVVYTQHPQPYQSPTNNLDQTIIFATAPSFTVGIVVYTYTRQHRLATTSSIAYCGCTSHKPRATGGSDRSRAAEGRLKKFF